MEASSISNNHYVLSGCMEDYQMGEHFWNFLTKSESKASYYDKEEADVECVIDAYDFEGMTAGEETEVEDGIDYNSFHNNIDGVIAYEEADEVGFHEDLIAAIEAPHGMPTYYSYANNIAPNPTNNVDYTEFIKATMEGNWSAMKQSIGSDYPEALTMKKFHEGGTALHHTLRFGQDRKDIAECLVKLMTAKALEIQDDDGYTPLALAAFYHHSGQLLKCMIEENPHLPNIGKTNRIPVVVASWKGFTDSTILLYDATQKEILRPDYLNTHDTLPGRVGINLLNKCIDIKLFGIAKELVEKFPDIVQLEDDEYISPIHALAKAMSAIQSLIRQKKSSGWKHVLSNFMLKGEGKSSDASHDDQESRHNREAFELLELIIRVADPDIKRLKQIHDAMIEASKHGNIEFIIEILKVDRELIGANLDGTNMFWHAIINRQEKVFNLIYGVGEKKDSLLSFALKDEDTNRREKVLKIYGADKKKESLLSIVVEEEDSLRDGNNSNDRSNILHIAAKLPQPSVLDRVSGAPLQMQREVQWFQAVREVAKPRYSDDLNKLGLTPYALFTETHKALLEAGEKSMKKTASSATTVSALIITTMFAAAFAVIGGSNQSQGSDSSLTKAFFITFIIFDALSVCSSTTSILVFLGILSSRYSQEDFRFFLPWRFMYGFLALFCSITTMMTAFCCGLFIMIQGGKLHFLIIPILLFSLVPVTVFITSICPLLWNIYRSTNRSIFDKNTKLPPSTGLKVVDSCY